MKYLLVAIVFVGLFFLVDARLSQVEQERCAVWQWEVCK
jgi:hypothetical protein